MIDPIHPHAADRRRAKRLAVDWCGHVSVSEQPRECLVMDISPIGALLQSSERFLPGQSIHLKLEYGGAFDGTVVWRGGGLVGVSFAEHERPIAA